MGTKGRNGCLRSRRRGVGKRTREQVKEVKYQEECQRGKATVATKGSHVSIQEGAEGKKRNEGELVQMKKGRKRGKGSIRILRMDIGSRTECRGTGRVGEGEEHSLGSCL